MLYCQCDIELATLYLHSAVSRTCSSSSLSLISRCSVIKRLGTVTRLGPYMRLMDLDYWCIACHLMSSEFALYQLMSSEFAHGVYIIHGLPYVIWVSFEDGTTISCNNILHANHILVQLHAWPISPWGSHHKAEHMVTSYA